MASAIISPPNHQASENIEATSALVDTKQAKSSSSSLTGVDENRRNGGIVYDVEHLATFSTTTGTCHETNNRSINGNDNIGGDKTKSVINNSTQNGSLTTAKATATITNTTTPKDALQRLFKLEKLSGIWTQHMQIELRDEFMLIVDCETNSTVERFKRECVTKPEAFNQYNDIYNNIIVFIIKQEEGDEEEAGRSKNSAENIIKESDKSECDFASKEEGEIHIFQCVSHEAQQLVADILEWKSAFKSNNQKKHQNMSDNKGSSKTRTSVEDKLLESTTSDGNGNGKKGEVNGLKANLNGSNTKPVLTVSSSGSASESVPIVNVNVKETVQVFNQIAALREKSKPSSPPTNRASRPLSDGSVATNASEGAATQSTLAPNSGGQALYKQRSIRASLAPPKSSSSAKTDADPKASASSVSSSSSSLEAAKKSPYHSSHHHEQAPANGKRRSNINHRNAEHAKQAPPPPPPPSNGQRMQHQVSSVSASSSSTSTSPPQAASKSSKATRTHQQQQKTHSDSSSMNQVTTNESYVSVLNHCFDDIEKFIIRLQQAAGAIRELQVRRKNCKRSSNQALDNLGNSKQSGLNSISNVELAMLNAKARGPNEDDYFEILSKFKLAFNLLAKLKGCIHEPNAPELVHFLFTPLAIIIESARNAMPPIDPTLVGIPYLNQDALDLLSNCCTSKESDLWMSLGQNWTQTIDMSLLKASRLPSSFQPIFSDGWAPVIAELELIGLVAPSALESGEYLDNLDQPDQKISNHNRRHSNDSRRNSQPPQALVDEHLLPTRGYPSAHDSLAYAVGQTQVNARLEMVSSSKSKGASRDHKKRILPPSQAYGTPSTTSDSYPSYPNQVSYGYQEETDSTNYRIPEHPSRRLDVIDKNQANSRRTKQSSKNVDYANPRYPLMNAQQLADQDERINIDLSQQQMITANLHHPDDYTELREHYIDGHLSHRPSTSSHKLSSYEENRSHPHSRRNSSKQKLMHELYNQHPAMPPYETDYFNEIEHEAMLLDLGPNQTEWFYELQSRDALIVRVLFTREANNDKELSVSRGEVLEILDDSRKWWRARNIDLQIGHVPHTIVAVMHGYQTLDELLANNPTELMNEDPNMVMSARFNRKPDNHGRQQWQNRLEDIRDPKTAGAFRYF